MGELECDVLFSWSLNCHSAFFPFTFDFNKMPVSGEIHSEDSVEVGAAVRTVPEHALIGLGRGTRRTPQCNRGAARDSQSEARHSGFSVDSWEGTREAFCKTKDKLPLGNLLRTGPKVHLQALKP